MKNYVSSPAKQRGRRVRSREEVQLAKREGIERARQGEDVLSLVNEFTVRYQLDGVERGLVKKGIRYRLARDGGASREDVEFNFMDAGSGYLYLIRLRFDQFSDALSA